MGNWGFLNSGNRDLGFLKSGNGELEGIWGLGIQISTMIICISQHVNEAFGIEDRT